MIRRLLPILAMLLLSACQALKTGEDIGGEGSPQLWQQHRQAVSQLEAWEINGKLAMRSQQQSGSGVLFWLQRQDYFDIRVTGPLGQGATRLTGRNGQPIRLTTPHRELQADSAEQMMQEQLGWSLPVGNLYWWVRGLPAPDSKYRLSLDSNSLAHRLEQDGWQLEFVRYQSAGDIPSLPERIQLQGPHLQLTLLVKQWQIRSQPGDRP